MNFRLPALLLLSAAPSLVQAGELKGRVVSGDRPASGVTLSALPYETPFEEARREARHAAPPAPLASATTAADGTFKLSVVPDAKAPAREFRLLLREPGLMPAITARVYDAAETDDLGDLSLVKAARLAGRVVAGDGKPVAGADVRLSAGASRFAGASDLVSWVRTAVTKPDGTFQFDDAAETANRLKVEAVGFAPFELSGVRAGAVVRPLVLAKGTAVSGTVRRPDGKAPAAGALVRFEGKASSRWVETALDGGFQIANVSAGTGTLVADGGDGTRGELGAVAVPIAEGKKPTIVLQPAAAITGRVVDAKTARPLGRVKVSARAGASPTVTRSGPDGRYRLTGLPPRRYRIEADEPRYVPFAKEGVALKPGETRSVDLPLTLGASLAGRVVDDSGAPIVGARGRLARGGETGLAAVAREFRGGQIYAFRTAADGSFKATRLPPGDNQRLAVTHDDYERRTLGGLNLPPGAVKSNLRIVMRHGLTVSGVVLDEARAPLAGAEVEIGQSRTFRGGRGGAQMVLSFAGGERRPRVPSGPDGRFEIKGLSPGDYSLMLRKPGFADASVDPLKVGEGEPAQPLEVTLSPGATIAGRVVRPNGDGAEGFIVAARLRGRMTEVPLGSRPPDPTGPDGAFTIEGLKPGETYEVQLLGERGLGPRKEVAAPAEGVEILVAGTGRIAGRALDARTGAPLTDFEASYGPDLSGGPGGMMVRFVSRAGRRGRSSDQAPIHSEDGTFALEDVPAGSWAVSVEAEGYQTARVGGVTVEAGLPTENVDVRLQPAPTLSGRVSDSRSGRPVLDATISSEPAGGEPGPRMPFDQGEGDVSTDAEGKFVLRGLGPGKYKLTARHPDYSEGGEAVEIKDGPVTMEIRLSAGGSLAGAVVSEAQRSLAGVDVTLQASGEGGFRGFGFASGQATVSDDAGRFRFDHLGAGRYAVVAALRGHSSPSVDVVLQSGETKDGVNLQLSAGATIHGAVTGLPDAMKAGVNVTARGAGDYFASARTAIDGLFELIGVPAGPVDLRGTAGDFLTSTRSASTQVVVPEGQADVPAELVFESGFRLSGRVARAGNPVADAFVTAFPQGGGGRSASGRSDAAGFFELDGLQEGTYNVAASLPQGGSSRRETVKVAGDATIDIVIPSARLAGTVVEAGSRQALPDAIVEVSSREGEGPFMRMASTDSNGRFALEDLEPKSYGVTVRRAGYQFEKRNLEAAEQGSDALVLELTRGEGIGVQARDGIFGVPLRGLFARALDAQGTPVFTGSLALDGEGRGEIPSLRPGRYTLLLDASGYAPVSLEGIAVPSPTLGVSFTPGGTLELRASPETLAGGPLRCRILKPSGAPYLIGFFSPTGEFTVSTPIRRLENIPPGRYTLAAEGRQPKPFNIEEGGTTGLDIP